MFFTYRTRWCPRTLRDIPYNVSRYRGCPCLDCRLIRAWRRLRALLPRRLDW